MSDLLLPHLHQLQDRHGFLLKEELEALARQLGRTPAELFGVASFYHFFSLEPAPWRLYFSDCILDKLRGAERLFSRLKERLEGKAALAWTSCTGLCDQGPALLIEGRAIGRLDEARLEQIAGLIEQGVPLERWPEELFAVEDRVVRRDLLLSSPYAPGEALERARERGAEWLLEELQRSGLRGRGGAGFPTWLKWKFCREAEGEHFVVCNADEGEPGTFKDRYLLGHHAEAVLEGMALAALAVGARRGFLYLRYEYRWLLPRLEEARERLRREGVLGEAFDVEIVLGAGAYICGEETALLNSIEGRRPHPRNRPPYPVTSGLFGQPTVVNNVESLFAATHIARNGGAWFAARGTEKSRGTKLLSISGDCSRPGIYEIPFGTPLKELLELCGASEPLGVQVGGPSGSFVGPRDFERRIAYEELSTAGAVMVFSRERDLLEIVENFLTFFRNESCGFCTPCRVGTELQLRYFQKLRRGWATAGDLKELEELSRILQASHCGLGHTAANPFRTTLAAYPERYEEKVRELVLSPGFDLDAELEEARRLTGRLGEHLRWEE